MQRRWVWSILCVGAHHCCGRDGSCNAKGGIYRRDITRPADVADSRLCIVVGRVPRFHTPLRVHIRIATAVPKILEAARLGRLNAVEATAILRAVIPIVRPPANNQASGAGHESSARTRVPHQHVSSVLHVCVPTPPPPSRALTPRQTHRPSLDAAQKCTQRSVLPLAPHPLPSPSRHHQPPHTCTNRARWLQGRTAACTGGTP